MEPTATAVVNQAAETVASAGMSQAVIVIIYVLAR